MTDQMRALRRENHRLRRHIESLERWVGRTGGGLQGMLAHRGLKVHRSVSKERLLIHEGLTQEQEDRFYRLLHRYSFRLLLRDLIRAREGALPEGLTTYCSLRAVTGYLTALRGLGLTASDPFGGWHLTRPTVTSFGETLEWFVAELFRREFWAEAMHSVSFRIPPPGGDFDVIACMEGLLVHVEVKSSPPRGIEAEEVASFLRRREILAPHVALFLVDTHLRMWDKMVPILEELAGGVPRDSGRPLEKVQRLEREIFHVGHRLYVLNASRGILSNLRCCLLDYVRCSNHLRSVPDPHS
jgi:hypothetical protein